MLASKEINLWFKSYTIESVPFQKNRNWQSQINILIILFIPSLEESGINLLCVFDDKTAIILIFRKGYEKSKNNKILFGSEKRIVIIKKQWYI